ncbi:MAG: dTDP-4-dehydrorhamnose reductase [Phycisphaeraceae bacterium]
MSGVAPSAGPVLLIGGSGMLGRAWTRLLDERGVEFAAPSHNELDITRPALIERQVTARFAVVVNCAAWSDVDGAEQHEAQAMIVNAAMVGLLAERCRTVNATLIHYSTDYVFNGEADSPYRIDQRRDPVNAYGRTKAEGERIIEQSGCRFLLVRSSWLYAPWGRNFVRTIARLARERDSLKVVNDQRGRPTSGEHLARTTLALIERSVTGIYHVTDGGECTWYDLACRVAAHVNPGCRIEPCTTDEFPRPAKRPRYSVLDLHYIEALVGPMPHWELNLADVLARLEPDDE